MTNLIKKLKAQSTLEKWLMMLAIAVAAFGFMGLVEEYSEKGLSLYIIPVFIAIALGTWVLTKITNKPSDNQDKQ